MNHVLQKSYRSLRPHVYLYASLITLTVSVLGRWRKDGQDETVKLIYSKVTALTRSNSSSDINYDLLGRQLTKQAPHHVPPHICCSQTQKLKRARWLLNYLKRCIICLSHDIYWVFLVYMSDFFSFGWRYSRELMKLYLACSDGQIGGFQTKILWHVWLWLLHEDCYGNWLFL